ncbi:mannose-6-phosphate isomerase-like isoform X2 [Physella acuta]|uniref:mannose-6-phosphate isomerase-like isoform X1 n=1 Tax=Physella acuta TaxID=109671 RepID=UPI0027DB2477|nr:mannose-6-phosphate isomerase-like isoform X1 [Physella acuta]XP_059177856.1 mannose-6-phosphate isomerase-like isoform X2 [Physella acuta]
MAVPQVFELKCAVQQYAWGKIGQDSEVARLKSSVDSTFKVDPETTYAELWMGTHPNGPSIVSIPGKEEIPLSEWVEKHPDQLGPEVRSFFKGNLPFLFKVLSVRTSLSIQAHPNKVHAELLHKTHPDLYKDPNHKPEMAIALTPFTGLCGFRPIKDVAHFLQSVDEFREAVGEKACKLITASHSMDMPLHREAMKDSFMALMQRDSKIVSRALTALVDKVKNLKKSSGNIKPYEGDVLLKLDSEFPGDRGCFAIYFLNIVNLEPGEAMFLEANLPHAYLSGDCMECMACSDNVVRAGLTPKYIDVHTLCEMLDYTGRPVNRTKFLGIESHSNIHITIFNPPVPDFGVSKYEVPAGTSSFQLQGFESASICIVVKGQGEATSQTLAEPLKLQPGRVFFVAAEAVVNIALDDSHPMLMFRAYSGVF